MKLQRKEKWSGEGQGMLTDAGQADEEEIRAGSSLSELLLRLPRLSVGTVPRPPACTLYPRNYGPSLRSPKEQESSLSSLEFSAPFLQSRPVNASPSPLPAHHYSNAMPMNWPVCCFSRAVLSLRCHKPQMKHVVVGWTSTAFQQISANDELLMLHETRGLCVTAVSAFYSLLFLPRAVDTGAFVDCTCCV